MRSLKRARARSFHGSGQDREPEPCGRCLARSVLPCSASHNVHAATARRSGVSWIVPGGVLVCLAFSVACGGGSPSSPTSVTSTTSSSGTSAGSGTSTGTTPSTITVAYTQDIKPILASDCTRCHSGSRPDGGVDLTTYANVLRYAPAGNANALLVRVTQSGGVMYSNLTGDRAGKASLIRQWVVNSGSAESR